MIVQRRGASAASPSHRRSRERFAAAILSLVLALSTALAAGTGSTVFASQDSQRSRVEAWLPPVGEASRLPRPDAIDAAEEPGARTIRLRPRPGPGPFSMNLYSTGDFVSQKTPYWCIAASTQTMINIMEDGKPRRSRKLQKRIHFQARAIDDRFDSFWQEVTGKPRWDQGLHGLGIRDWQMVLDAKGYGPYEVDRAKTRKQAIRKAARAIRLTGRPAGLVVWRGAHAWVMSGFTASADPAWTNRFKVKTVFIQDPWYPAVSSIWGRSRPPNSEVAARALAADYLPYNRPGRRHPKRDGKYMLILPTLPPGTDVVNAR